MSDCLIENKPISCRRYFDDTFLKHSSELHVIKFLNNMNSKHRNTVLREENNPLSFLHIKFFCGSGKLHISLSRMSTFSGVLTKFGNFLPILYKCNLIATLLHRGFMICSSNRTLHFEMLKLKQIFQRNVYPKSFVDCFVLFCLFR